ncbi:MAG: hypothetical protein JWL92_21 [Candidatus Nomurabacteria bacterium]|nr:hypothetical protein [Candidatus Nomurabacteria bacterium]
MKKTLLIILIIVLIVLGGIAASRHEAEAPVITPSTTDISTTTPEPTPSTDTRARGPERKTIAIGASAEVNGVIIKVNSLVQDSRCPTKVTCIQAGSVSVKATVSNGTVSTDHEFNSNTRPFAFEGYSIAIVDVTPVPTIAPNAIKLSDYRITFEVIPTAKGDTI